MVTCKEKKMRKKGLLILVLVSVLAGGISAQESFFSVGGGILADGEGGYADGSGYVTNHLGTELWGFGAWVFADAKYAELSIGLYGGPLHLYFSEGRDLDSSFEDNSFDGTFFALDFSLLGKYPFVISKKGSSIFPLLGIGYQLVTSASLGGMDVDTPSDLSAFKILIGVGADFALGEKFFIRSSLLGFYRFPSKMLNDYIDAANAIPGVSASYDTGFGATVKVAFGVKL
jgi:hypothetical protein